MPQAGDVVKESLLSLKQVLFSADSWLFQNRSGLGRKTLAAIADDN